MAWEYVLADNSSEAMRLHRTAILNRAKKLMKGEPIDVVGSVIILMTEIQEWEVAAYHWLQDAEDKAKAWERFAMAYPEHVRETLEEFWERIICTRYHHEHKHDHHHQPYV